MMKLKNIKLSYDQLVVVDDLTMNIEKGSITTIIGPNGCGKSTLLKAMSRILEPIQGDILLDGKDLFSIPTKEIARKLAFLPQSQNILNGLTVFELISYGRYPYQKGVGKLSEKDMKAIHKAMDLTHITELKDRGIDQLSGGQRQRVWIAMSLAQETDMIFLDEPTTYLDIAHQLDVLHLLEKLNKETNKTIVMVLHDINQAAYFSDYVIAIKEGKVIKSGLGEDVITKEIIKDVFQVDVEIMFDQTSKKPITFNYKRI
ncbi:ABC transporter ATP-binding protein [Mycoplasmatota bacterium]|nr:ABC transporter ATP-binding protein [Mycoplasmatota bacterium]